MTNEIKEKIEYLKKFAGIYEGTMITEIEDYITNLQEEKENAVECLKYYEEKHFIKPAVDNTKLTIELYNAYLKEINNLQEENERLKKQYAKEEKKLFHDNEILQQRIDKAINYILENICCDTRVYTRNENVYKVVKILRGDE